MDLTAFVVLTIHFYQIRECLWKCPATNIKPLSKSLRALLLDACEMWRAHLSPVCFERACAQRAGAWNAVHSCGDQLCMSTPLYCNNTAQHKPRATDARKWNSPVQRDESLMAHETCVMNVAENQKTNLLLNQLKLEWVWGVVQFCEFKDYIGILI